MKTPKVTAASKRLNEVREFKDETIKDRAKLYFEMLIVYPTVIQSEQKHIEKMLSFSWGYTEPFNLSSSKKAWELAYSLGVPELENVSWNDQTKSIENGGLGEENRGSETKMFHWEHAVSRDTLVKAMIKLTENPNGFTHEDIESIVKTYQVVWITNDENKKLNEKYKSERPKGWKKAYADCGIEVITGDDEEKEKEKVKIRARHQNTTKGTNK